VDLLVLPEETALIKAMLRFYDVIEGAAGVWSPTALPFISWSWWAVFTVITTRCGSQERTGPHYGATLANLCVAAGYPERARHPGRERTGEDVERQ